MKNLKKVFIFVMISLILTLGIRQPCEVMASVKTITYDTGDSYIGNVDDSESSDPDEEEPDIFLPSREKEPIIVQMELLSQERGIIII